MYMKQQCMHIPKETYYFFLCPVQALRNLCWPGGRTYVFPSPLPMLNGHTRRTSSQHLSTGVENQGTDREFRDAGLNLRSLDRLLSGRRCFESSFLASTRISSI